MKKIFFLLLITAGYIADAQFKKAELQASGLTCSMCSFATQKQLKTLNFIDSIGTDLNHTIFLLYFKKDAQVDLDMIRKKVEDAGFSVASLKVFFTIGNIVLDSSNRFTYQDNSYQVIDPKTQTLHGDELFKVLDKGFIPDKEYKKVSKSFALTQDAKEKPVEGSKIHHIKFMDK